MRTGPIPATGDERAVSDIPEDLDITDELIAERRGGEPGDLPHDMAGWMRSAITRIDTFSLWCGRIFCWMLVPLMLAMVWEVLARKLFAAPTMWAYDVSRMLSGALFLVGAGYALMRGVHHPRRLHLPELGTAPAGDHRRRPVSEPFLSGDDLLPVDLLRFRPRRHGCAGS